MKKLFALLLALCLLLCACGDDPSETAPQTQPSQETSAPTTEPATEATEPETQPTEPETQPTEPEPAYRNPLTGEGMKEPYMNRPYAVVMNNDKKALPHWGVGQADMVWEMPHEGGITRIVGMYTDIGDVEKLGPNRSARPYLISLAMSFDAIFVHAGGSTQAYKDLASTDWDNLDGVKGTNAWKYYHRDKDRLNNGVALEHTMYITGPEVLEYTADRKYETTRGEEVDYGLNFAEDATPEGESAETIKIRFRKDGKKTNLYYDAESGKYTAEQYDRTYTDGNDGSTVEFENVLILRADVGRLNDYGALKIDMVDSGEGYFACGGKIVPIRWNRDSTDSPITYTLADGTPLTLGVGTTYVAMVYQSAPISYE